MPRKKSKVYTSYKVEYEQQGDSMYVFTKTRIKINTGALVHIAPLGESKTLCNNDVAVRVKSEPSFRICKLCHTRVVNLISGS